jgi:hypothetical protein
VLAFVSRCWPTLLCHAVGRRCCVTLLGHAGVLRCWVPLVCYAVGSWLWVNHLCTGTVGHSFSFLWATHYRDATGAMAGTVLHFYNSARSHSPCNPKPKVSLVGNLHGSGCCAVCWELASATTVHWKTSSAFMQGMM